MGSSVILPSMTDQMVLGVFKYLVESELCKSLQGSVKHSVKHQFGCQQGMIAGVALMFGVTSENLSNNWLQIVEEIREKLQDWVDLLDKAVDRDEIDFEELQNAVDAAVNNYALKHPKKLGDALRHL